MNISRDSVLSERLDIDIVSLRIEVGTLHRLFQQENTPDEACSRIGSSINKLREIVCAASGEKAVATPEYHSEEGGKCVGCS